MLHNYKSALYPSLQTLFCQHTSRRISFVSRQIILLSLQYPSSSIYSERTINSDTWSLVPPIIVLRHRTSIPDNPCGRKRRGPANPSGAMDVVTIDPLTRMVSVQDTAMSNAWTKSMDRSTSDLNHQRKRTSNRCADKALVKSTWQDEHWCVFEQLC